MGGRRRTPAVALALFLAATPAGASEGPRPDDLAKEHFGAVVTASPPPPRVIGFYSRGCLAGAAELPPDGPTWQAMRLSRGRNWGHPSLIAFVKDLAAAAPEAGLSGILVGDLAQPRGGPMPYGHTSHQTGLDVDIWFRQMPEPRLTEDARETHPFRSVLTEGGDAADPERLTLAFMALLERAALDGRVERIFVHPVIKRAMCGATWEDRAFLSKIRPWYGHDAHFHVRLACPDDSPDCRPQGPPPPGDGCGAPLDYWFTPAPYTPDPDAKPRPPLTVARMPAACRALIGAE
jgi:penicillin-insensitive murein endopeptidase